MSLELLLRFPEKKILVIGDLMLDHYIMGDVHRISPEAPVPVVKVNNDHYAAGGAANVALNLAALGIEVYLMGHIGNDDSGEKLLALLAGKNVTYLSVPTEPGTTPPTIIKTRVVVRNQQLCRIDREDGQDAYQLDKRPGFEAILKATISEMDAVIVSDYAKGVVTQSLLDRISDFVREKPGLLVAIDPKPSRKLKFSGIGLLTPNKAEAFQMAAMNETHHLGFDLEETCRKIFETYSPKLLVITLGAEGMAICKNGQVEKRLPTQAKEVFDVSGAGDTVIATLTASLVAGATIEAAAKLANKAAGCVVAHLGTVPVDLDELKASLH